MSRACIGIFSRAPLEARKQPIRTDKALQMPIFLGDKRALILFSPMVAIFAGVKANNSIREHRDLRFVYWILSICCRNESSQIAYTYSCRTK